MRNLIPLFALAAFSTACFEVEMPKGSDTGDTGAEDSGGGDDTSTPAGTAQVRFVNLSSSASLTMAAIGEGDDTTGYSQDLSPLSGSAFYGVVAGSYDLAVTNSDGSLAETDGVSLEDGHHYSVAFTPAGTIVVTETDEDGLSSDATRITFINVQADSNAKGYMGYWVEADQVWQGSGLMFTLGSDEAYQDDYDYITTAAQFEVVFDGLDSLLVDWNAAAYMQVDPGSSVNVYFWTEGDCSFGSSTCQPMILGQFADGSTSTVDYTQAPGYGWAG